MSSFATTPGKRLVIPTSSTAYSPARSPVAPASSTTPAMPPPTPRRSPVRAPRAAPGPAPRLRRAGHRDRAADDRGLVGVELGRDVGEVVAGGGVADAVDR